jgi:hypothetical protein
MRAGGIATVIVIASLGSSFVSSAWADGTQPPATPTLAQPSERVASTGWFAEGGLGATAFLPSASSDAAVGPSLDLRFGRDLFSWLSVGIFLAMSTHEATVPPPPTDEYFQLYRGGADARLQTRFNRIALFVEAGVGAAYISTNILDQVMITKPGTYASLALQGGAGIEYQLENRHYGFGLAGDTLLAPGFASVKVVDTRLYLRYTY